MIFRRKTPGEKETSKLHKALAKAFWNITDHYSFTQKEQAILLGIKESKGGLNSYRKKVEIPDDPDTRLRVSHLIGIHENLRNLFPHNREIIYAWMKTKRDLFEGKSAMEYISEDEHNSLPRIFSVRCLLDQILVSS